jgi:hypothetical protein
MLEKFKWTKHFFGLCLVSHINWEMKLRATASFQQLIKLKIKNEFNM